MKLSTQLIFRILLPIVVLFSRLGVLPANISPLGSYGFFSRQTILFFTTIVAFDYFVGGFYPGFWVVYLGFAIYPLLGKLAQHNPRRQLLLLPLASFLFFLISNMGVWWYWYPHTLTGLITCFTLALPFYTRTLTGDLIFGYSYLTLKHILPRLQTRPSLSKAIGIPL